MCNCKYDDLCSIVSIDLLLGCFARQNNYVESRALAFFHLLNGCRKTFPGKWTRIRPATRKARSPISVLVPGMAIALAAWAKCFGPRAMTGKNGLKVINLLLYSNKFL